MKRATSIAAFLVLVSTAFAQGPAPTPIQVPPAPGKPASAAPTATPDQPHQITRADLEPFLDSLIASQLARQDIAGATVGVVKDGSILFSKGYGYADVAAKKPVSPETTLFRPGSISKLFTAISVMQLVEQGKLDLNRDVADYLDFPIQKSFPEPITLRRLLTHTAGFEEVVKNLFVTDASKMTPLRDYLVNQMPAQIFHPGRVPSYSNWGLTLAGYIVERTSGEKFDAYVDAHILKPLRMGHATFTQPLPPDLAPDMSNGYMLGSQKPRGFEFVQAAPAGSMSVTANDMCRFMLALLAGGQLDGASILKPETLAQMQSRQFELHPDVGAVGLVFLDYSTNGIKGWGHGGDSIYFHSDLWLIPQANFGLFISYNSAGKPPGGRGEVRRAIFNRYFPRPATTRPATVDEATAKRDAREVSGAYLTSRRGEATLLKLGALLGQFTVHPNEDDGTISIDQIKNLNDQPRRWREIGPLLFEDVDGSDHIAFLRDADGRVAECVPPVPAFEGQRTPWYESQKFVFCYLGVSLGILLLSILLWPVAAWIRRRYERPLFLPDQRRARLAWRLVRLICLVELLWFGAFAYLMISSDDNIALIGDGVNPWLTLMHVIGWLLAVGVIWSVIASWRLRKTPALRAWPRLHTMLLAACSVALMLLAVYTHLLSPSLRF
jgi:CubicO group peptidase (beta-lactamase class C family)